MTRYARTPEELKCKASIYWPAELVLREANASIIPLLLETQDKFISLLDVADASPVAWKEALKLSNGLRANVFLKHLMVLADLGGENLKRLRPDLKNIFPDDIMTYIWQGKNYEYKFKTITKSARLDNPYLYIDGKKLLEVHDLEDKMEDVIMLLLYGGAAVSEALPDIVKEKCNIGSLIGQATELETFVKQRYIWVSRITQGATSNAMGQLAQDYVKELLETSLPSWNITRNGTIPNISHNDGKTDISFDVLAQSPTDKYVAIEISFQFTTNSVIERKAGQAQARANLLRAKGHRIAYVIDGAGNFERNSALSVICNYSDCTVGLTPGEIDVLIQFLREVG